MSVRTVVTAADAVALVQDGDVVASSGYGGNGTPEALFQALEQRFLDHQAPHNLTLVWAGGQGDGKGRGLNHLGHEGLIRRTIGGHYGLIPTIERLAVENRIAAYNLPEGVLTHLYRDIAAGKAGTLSRVGIGTFVDPRIEGGKVNAAARDDIVEVVELGGRETLFFKAFPINVALIRGTSADPEGNVTMERETLQLETLALAMAAPVPPDLGAELGLIGERTRWVLANLPPAAIWRYRRSRSVPGSARAAQTPGCSSI